jgi:thioredoxin reductase (NADPH)
MVIIIGAGPVGLACGIALQKRNIPFLILEKGCLVNSLYHYPTNMTFFSTSDRLEIGGVPFISHGVKPTRREALEYYRRITESFALPVNLYETVTELTGELGAFEITTSKATYVAERVIISSGFYSDPYRMNIPGEDLPKVKHYYDEPHAYAFQKVIVVGGGNSAVDVALETYRCGSDVTLVVREPALKDGVKYWVRPDIENRIKEGTIRAYFNSELTHISESEVEIRTPEGVKTLANDFVLAMTGYQPDFNFLEKAGVAFHDDEFKTPKIDENSLESNRPGLYLAGVIIGGYNTGKWFIENTRTHGEMIAAHIGGK